MGIGLLSGTLYAIVTLNNGGMASNTEIFFTTFVIIAFYLFFLTRGFRVKELLSKQYLELLLAGFILGIGFEIKYVVSFDFLALSMILILTYIKQFRSSTKYWLILKNISFLSLGSVLPFVIVSLYFWLIGYFDDYMYANFTANKLRTLDVGFSFMAPLKAIARQIYFGMFFWLSMPSLAVYLFIAKTIPTRERWILSSFIIWFLITLLCICTVFRGTFYPHYFLQLSPSLCLVTAYIIISLIFPFTRNERYKIRQYLIFGVFLILLINTQGTFGALKYNATYIYFRHAKGIRHWGDTHALVAEYLKSRIKSSDYIYTVYQPIVYFLTDAKIPTRYAFPAFLVRGSDMPDITGIDPLEELDLILQKYPIYILMGKIDKASDYYNNNKLFFEKLNQALNENYHLENSIGRCDLYRLNFIP